MYPLIFVLLSRAFYVSTTLFNLLELIYFQYLLRHLVSEGSRILSTLSFLILAMCIFFLLFFISLLGVINFLKFFRGPTYK